MPPSTNLVRVIALATVTVGIALIALKSNHVGVAQTGIATVLAGVVGAAFAWCVAWRRNLGLPIFPVSLLFYVFAFAPPLYLLAFIWPDGEPAILLGYRATHRGHFGTVDGFAMVLAGVAAYTIGFIAARVTLFQRLPHFRLPRDYEDGRLRLLLWVLLAGHLAYVFVSWVTAIPSVGQFLLPAGHVAFGMFFLLWVRGRLSPLQAALVFLVALPAVLINSFLDWLITPIMLMGLFFVFVYYHNFQRAPLIVMLVAALFLFVNYTGIQYYRVIEKNPAWIAQQGQVGTIDRIANFGRLLVQIWITPDEGEWRLFDRYHIKHQGIDALRPVVKRIALLPVLSHVVDKTPDPVPYWRGESYRNLLISFVSRLIWPDKPEERLGNEFGHRYMLLHPDDDRTSVNIPWLVELYANYGGPGVFWGMLLIGVFMAFVDRFFNAPGMSALEVIVGLAIIFPLVYQESNFTVMTGSLVPLAISLWIYFRVGLTVAGGRPPPD